MTTVLRFAPSPTGPLHLGSARTAALNWLAARQQQGRFLLRLEDTDTTRGHERFEQDITHNLAWLGLDFDDGPPTPGFRQSQCLSRYDEALRALHAVGRVYGCDCSPQRLELVKKRQLSTGQPPRYDGHCRQRGLPLDPPNVVRFVIHDTDMAQWEDLLKGHQQFTPRALGDFVLRTSEGRVLFDLAGVVDDQHMAITHVLRGEDHLTNTARHHLAQKALGYAHPHYGHLPLLKEESGAKLSKRALEGLGLSALREVGYLSQAVLLYALDLGEGLVTDEQIPELFDPQGKPLAGKFPPWQKLAHAGGRVDLHHLDFFQRRLVHHLGEAALAPQARQHDGINERTSDWGFDLLREFWLCTPKLADLARQLQALEDGGHLPADIPQALKHGLAAMSAQDTPWRDEAGFKAAIKAVAGEAGCKAGAVFHALRAVLAGADGGPGLWTVVQALGAENARERLMRRTAHG